MRLLILILCLFFASPAQAVEAQQKPEQIVIAQWGKEKILLYLPLYIAMEKGYFREEGLEVKLQYAGNDDQVFASVISGSASFGVGDPVFAAIAREKGFPGRVVALLVEKLGISGFTKRDDIEVLEKPADLAGYSIATFPAPSTTYTLITQLLARSTSTHSNQIVQTAIGAQIAALEAGDADIAVDLEPAVSVAEEKGYRVVFGFDQFTPSLAITGLTTTDEMIHERPETVRKVVASIEKALALIHRNPSEAGATAAALFPHVSSAVVQRAFRRMIDLGVYPEHPAVPNELWQRTLGIRLESGELKKKQKTKETVDNSFAERGEETEGVSK